MPRERIPSALKHAVQERDQRRCQKCWHLKALDIHHILPVVEGGTNDLDNLILLCSMCHREWHLVQEGWPGVDFREWLVLPPFIPLLRWFVMDFPGEHDLREAKKSMMESFRIVRQQYIDNPEDFAPLDDEDFD